MTDFEILVEMLKRANRKIYIDEVEGEHAGIRAPSEYPDRYTTGIYFSFNNDGSLYAVHSYEPDEGEE